MTGCWGDCPLTPHELAVVGLLAEGLTYKQIAERSGRAVSTVRTHLHHAYRRLGVTNGAQAVIQCADSGWIPRSGRVSDPAADMRKLERLLNELTAAVRERREEGVTLLQRRYLDAFEEHLYATDATKPLTAVRLSVAFGRVAAEAGIATNRDVSRRMGRHETFD